MIFITVSQKGYSDSKLYGPFKSIEEGKKKITDGLDRGNDGEETRYTFFNVVKIKEIGDVHLHDEYEIQTQDTRIKEIGYVHFHDECKVRTQDIREEYFPNV